jgi:2-dehydro-3-deoxyphosphogluconate aldolase/(4S)-4-hydroxy-2-oxoglutarate aldolase
METALGGSFVRLTEGISSMSQFSQLEVYAAIQEVGLIPLFYQPDPALVLTAVQACAAGGARVVEFTNRGEGAHRAFTAAIKRVREEVPLAVFGVGSVVDAPTAALYIASGADFVVGPYLRRQVASLCRHRGVAYIPGASTPAEIARAERCGADIVKVFPARTLGPAFIQDVMGPSPQSRLLPTGGVKATEESVSAWIRAGAVAVGIGSQLIVSYPAISADLDSLADRVAEVRGWIDRAREATRVGAGTR